MRRAITKPLTTSIDSPVGTSGPDTFSGVVDGTTVTVTTLNAGDKLTGGAGADRLIVAAQGAVGSISGVSTDGIETIQIQSVQTGTGTTLFDALLTAGLTDVAVTGSSTAVSVTNLQTIPNLAVSSNNANVTVGFRSATTVAGESDAMKIALNGNNTASASTITANGIETVNITSSGAASGATARPVTIASSTLKNVVVDGSAGMTGSVTLSGATIPGKAGVVDLSASTASSLTMTVTAGSNGQTSIMGSAGADSLIITPGATGELTVTGGAGNDTVRIAGSSFSTKTSIDGGDGTNTLNLTDAVASAAVAAGVKGFQTVGAYSATTATGGTAGISRTVDHKIDLLAAAPSKVQVSTWSFANSTDPAINSALTDTVTFSGLSAATTDLAISGVSVSTGAPTTIGVTQNGTGGTASVALTVAASMKVDTAADTLNVTLGSATGGALTATTGTATTSGSNTYAPGAASGTLSLNVADFETVTLTSNSDAITTGNTLTSVTATSLKSLTIGAGSAPLTIASFAAAPNALTTIDASASTQAFDMSGVTLGAVKAVTVTGGAGNDKLKGGSLSDNLSGGAGTDIITGGGGNDTIAGGDGNDTLSGLSGADSISGGDGVDSITGGGGNDVLDGGAGNDIFNVSVTTSNVASGSGGDSIQITAATKVIGGDGTDTLALSGGVANATAYTLNFASSTESRFTGVSGVETIQLGDFASAAGVAATVNLALGDIAMGSFGGSVNVTAPTTSATVRGLVTVDASSVLNSASTVKYTGPAGTASTYIVGNNIDNVTLSSGNDTVTVSNAIFLSASDSIDGGLGTDTLTITQAGSTAVALSTATLANVKGFESITASFGAGTTGGLSFTLSDAFALANRTSTDSTLTIDVSDGAGALGALTVNGTAVAAGTTLAITSSGRADALTGGAGNDIFIVPASTLKNGEVLNGGDGTDVIRLTGTGNSLNGVTLTSVEGIQFGGGTAVNLSALASVFNGATYTIAETNATSVVNTLTLTANGAAVLDFSKVTPVAFGSSQSASAPHSLNDQVIISFDTSLDRGIAHTYSGSGLSDVVTLATGAAAISDTISGGAGNDVFKMILGAANATTDHLAGSAASFTDVLSGGSGTTDNLEITLGATASALTIANTLDWSNLSGIEVLSIAANDAAATPVPAGAAAISITPAATAFTTAGLRQITLANDQDPLGSNTINASAQLSTSVGLTLTGGAGRDVITGGAGNDSITGGAGNDALTGGTGVDTFAFTIAQSVASTANTLTGAGIAAGNTVTFGNGVDYISDFAATDLLDLTTAAAAPTSLLGVATGTALTAGTSYVAYGTWNAGTGVFTIAGAFDASTAKDAMLIVDGNAQTAITTTGVVILDDLTAALAAANIV